MRFNSQNIKIDKLLIPAFNLKEGEIVRLWIDISRFNSWGLDLTRQFIKLIDRDNSIHYCENKLELSLLDYVFGTQINKYFKRKFGYSELKTNDIVSNHSISGDWKIQNLGLGHQKDLSIISGFQSHKKIIAFNCYGYSVNSINRITDYAKREIKTGKSVIIFHIYNENRPAYFNDDELITDLFVEQV